MLLVSQKELYELSTTEALANELANETQLRMRYATASLDSLDVTGKAVFRLMMEIPSRVQRKRRPSSNLRTQDTRVLEQRNDAQSRDAQSLLFIMNAPEAAK